MAEEFDLARSIGKLEGQHEALARMVSDGFSRLEMAVGENRKANRQEFETVHSRISGVSDRVGKLERQDAADGHLPLRVKALEDKAEAATVRAAGEDAERGMLKAIASNGWVQSFVGVLLAIGAFLGGREIGN